MDENQYSTSNAFHTVTPAMEPPAPAEARSRLAPWAESVGGLRGPRCQLTEGCILFFVFCFL